MCGSPSEDICFAGSYTSVAEHRIYGPDYYYSNFYCTGYCGQYSKIALIMLRYRYVLMMKLVYYEKYSYFSEGLERNMM